MPALTAHAYGQGEAYHVAADGEPAFWSALLGQLCAEIGISAPVEAAGGVEVCQRHQGGQAYTFVMNHNAAPASVRLPWPAWDMLTGRELSGEVTLAAYDVLILSRARR
jgi:beta-galactosidase